MAAASAKKSKRKQKTEQEDVQLEEDDNKPGCIYLGHIPHGFYEEEMKEYFGQFGHVLAVKVCRSKKSANSKGYGFVKFRYAAVAKTVAETCNNYLFYNKLLKCQYKPMSEIHRDTFRFYSITPKTAPRRQYNSAHTGDKMAQVIKRSVSRAQKKLERLKAVGLNVELSEIMDVPEVPVVEKKVKKKGVKKSDKKTRSKGSSTPEPQKKKKVEQLSTPKTVDKELSNAESSKKKRKNAETKISTPKTLDKELSKTESSKKKRKNAETRLSTPKTVDKELSNTESSKKKRKNAETKDAEQSASDSPPKKRTKLSSSPSPSGKKSASTPQSQKVKKTSTPKSALLKKTPIGRKSRSPKVVTPGSKGKKSLKK